MWTEIALLGAVGWSLYFLMRALFDHVLNVTPFDAVKSQIKSLARTAGDKAKNTPKGFLDKPRSQIIAVLGTVSFGMLSFGSSFIVQAMVVGAMVGLGIAYGTDVLERRAVKTRQIKEIIQLYDLMDLLTTKCNYTLYNALQVAESLLPNISGAIRKCLQSWPYGASRALSAFGDDLGTPEAQVLVSVLQSAQEVGAGRLTGLLSEEAMRVEELRRKAVEIGMEARPMIQGVYVNLPLVVMLGMGTGPLVYDLLQIMTGTKAPLFH